MTTMRRLWGWAALWLCTSTKSANVQATQRPIIGVYAQPTEEGGDAIVASYVKWIESAGARVVPLPYDGPYDVLRQRFESLNGLLFPGGGVPVNDKVRYLYNLAIQANDAGDYFPIWGTCLGMEWLLELTSNDSNVLESFDAWNISMPLVLTPEARRSRLFRRATPQMLTALITKPVTMNNHHQGLHPATLASNEKLSKFYKVLAQNQDRKGEWFISAVEATQYPFYGVQFHPEKSVFEWGAYATGVPYEAISHSRLAVEIAQYFANFFVTESLRSTHRFPSPLEEKEALIYNHQPRMVEWPEFVQVYVFPAQELHSINFDQSIAST